MQAVVKASAPAPVKSAAPPPSAAPANAAVVPNVGTDKSPFIATDSTTPADKILLLRQGDNKENKLVASKSEVDVKLQMDLDRLVTFAESSQE